MPGTAKDGIEGVADTALEPVSPQFTFVFHVANRWLNGASSADSLPDRLCDTAFLATAPDRHPLNANTAIAFIDKYGFGFLASQKGDLLNGLG